MASSPPPSYQVFLSFRGDDTRRTFLSHLHEELVRLGIRTFKDDTDINKGESISSELCNAIKQSLIAIVVFSKNYAFSTWCLDELLMILRCSKLNGQKVIPVFYEVDPSDVRKQGGRFKEAFVKHQEDFGEEKTRNWKAVMTKVAENGGWDSKNWSDDAELIRNIVRHVSDRLFPTSSVNNSYLVGMDSNLRELNHWLCSTREDVRMLGIWGMGGIGKTTTARLFYETNRKQFENCCFIENVKGLFRKHRDRPVKLQEKFLSELFRERDIKLWDAGSDAIKERLCCKKVLVVLDDVDELDQLHVFAKELEWFGPGSRIIITTRDVRILKNHKVQNIHKVQLLRDSEAQALFSKYAFEQDSPRKGFHGLVKLVISYANGLPLALRVLGLMFRGRTVSEWEETLKKLSITPNKNISKVLKHSYDGLDKDEKDIFLYIACVFSGNSKHYTTRILNGCGLNAELGIKSLVEKSLIVCDEKSCIHVHDLLQDMARDIIREDCPDEPWKYKIVWDSDDIEQLFSISSHCSEIIKVEGIFADMYKAMELVLCPMTFKRMYNLKLLKIINNIHGVESKLQLPEGLGCLPRKLAYLFWDGFPSRSLPSRFNPEKLVEIHLPRSSVEKLWDGTQPLRNLRVMNLECCLRLIEVPDLSMATTLESLNLFKCESLVDISTSFGNLQFLKRLKLSRCRKLKKLPEGINLKSLKFFHPYGCSSLSSFPCISENLRFLSVIFMAIEEVPPSIMRLSRLECLNISGCKKLKILPCEIQHLSSLHTLDISNCPSITTFPKVGKRIRWLRLKATAIDEVPTWIGNRTGLLVLDLSFCERLTSLPKTIHGLTSLNDLNLRGCSNITEFPEIPLKLTFLCLQGTGIQKVYCKAMQRRVKDLVVKGQYDAAGRWTTDGYPCIHNGLVLTSEYDYFQANPMGVDVSGGIPCLLERRGESFEI